MATKHVLDILAVYEAGFLWDPMVEIGVTE
jgi:hypothetical protein